MSDAIAPPTTGLACMMMAGVTAQRLREGSTSRATEDPAAMRPLGEGRGVPAAVLSPPVLLVLAAFASPVGLLLSLVQVWRARLSGHQVSPLVWLALGISLVPIVATVALLSVIFFMPF